MLLTEQDKGDRFILHNLFQKRRVNRATKEAFFYYEDQTLMIAQGKESYVVVSNDMAVGYPLFMDGEADFQKFVTAISLLQKKNIHIRTLWDIGANVGSIAIPALRRGFVQKAVAFEPEEQLMRLLRANAILNGVDKQMHFQQVALGEVSSVVDLMMGPGNTGDYRICGRRLNDDTMGEEEMIPQRVQMRPMDHFVQDFSVGATLLFMDIQGYEGRALRGAKRIMNSSPPLVVEFWPYGMKRAESYPHLKEIICGGAYTCFADLAADPPEFTPLAVKSLDALYEKSGERSDWSTDILFV